jgi:tetratricopeptide (TPR) repeat protein
MKRFSWPILLAVSLGLTGCATRYVPGKPLTGDPYIDGENAIQYGPAKDKVLWQYRTAAVAMRRGQFAEAKRLLEDALTRIANTLGKDPSARKSRSYFSPEAKKTFIGEPYERVMAYYYRGILYWMDGEPDNARACFRSAALEDSGTADKKYSSDYVLLDYLDGLATTKLGGDGADALKRAEAEAKLSHPPAVDPKANVMVFVEFGQGPVKYAAGEYAQLLMFHAGISAAHAAQVQVDQKNYQLRPYDDLYFQATTRGGRVMDHILANKAGFKRATDTAGNVGLIGGLVLAQRRETQGAALGLAAAGLLSKITSASTTPEADIRSWDNLPLFLSFAALELSPGPHTITVDFLDQAGRALPGQTKTINITVPAASGDKVVFVSDKSSTPQNQ